MIEFRHVTFTYPQKSDPVFNDLQLTFQTGQTVLISGASGSGKSTLLRLINGLVPHFSGGTVSGKVLVNQINPIEVGPHGMNRQVGFVFQDPETQFVMERVEDELAFGLENAAVSSSEMKRRIQEILGYLEIEHLRKRRLENLSGGEKQKVAIASALVLNPSILVLDEPTSQLDVQSAGDILYVLEKLKILFGLTIILAEHRLERILSFCDHLVILEENPKTWFSGSPQQALTHSNLVPPLVTIAKSIHYQPLPITPAENHAFAKYIQLSFPQINLWKPMEKAEEIHSPKEITPYLHIEHLRVQYADRTILQDLSLSIHPNESIAVIGRNGAGKSTLLRAIMGLVNVVQGQIYVEGKSITPLAPWQRSRFMGYLPQDPNALLFADTVLEELQVTLNNYQLRISMTEKLQLLEKLGIAKYANAYPRDLSVGERQRVALAAILVVKPKLVMLDEPTRGLDYQKKQDLILLLRELQRVGLTLLVVTHDVEFLAQFAKRVIWLDKGSIIADGDLREVLVHAGVYTPELLHYFPQQGFLTVQEVLNCLAEKERNRLTQPIS